MNTIEIPQPIEQVATLEDILDIEFKICEILNIGIEDITLDPPSFDLKTLNVFKLILRKIYNRLLRSPNEKKNLVQLDNSHTFESFQEKEAYQQIQDLLQKQENKNRLMLKKQFEFKEYLNSVIDQLNQQKSSNRKLYLECSKLNQQMQQKSLEILHLKNKSKAFQRGNKDIFVEQKPSIKNKNSYHLSSFSNFNGFQLGKDQKQILTSRQRANTKSQMRKSKIPKQNAIYALYNFHKKSVEMNKNHSYTDTTKKSGRTRRQSCKKSPFKDLNSQDFSNKKLFNLRRKSEQILKKTLSHREVKEQRHSKKKSYQQIINHTKII